MRLLYRTVPRAQTGEVKPQPEVKQRGLRRITVKAPAKVPYLVLGYQVPSLATAETEWEPYALEVLAAVLDGDDSARFSKDLIRGQQVASQAGAGYDMYSRLSTLFMFDGTPAEGHSLEDLEQAIQEQIARVRSEPISDAELARVKTRVVAADVYQRDSLFYQAMRLGALETAGLGWQVGEKYVSRVQAVTPAQVQAVAQKFLTDDRLTVAELEVQPLDMAASQQAMTGGRNVSQVR